MAIASVEKSVFLLNIGAIVFPFFSSYSRFIIQIYFPAAANSQNVPSAAIVVNSLLTVALSVKYYFVVIIAIKSFL